MCGLEVPDLFQTVRARFGPEEVTLFAINYGESAQVVADYIADTGLSEPVLMDSPGDSGCHMIPEGDPSLYDHFDARVGDPFDGPFPLQIVIDARGEVAFSTRFHNASVVVGVLEELLDGADRR